MAKPTKKMRAFLEDILTNRLSVETAMAKNSVSGELLKRWFSSPVFLQTLAKDTELAAKRADILISQNRITAAEKLVSLTNCDKEETARKACLDIIELTGKPENAEDKNTTPVFSPETAEKLLKILANEKQTNTKNK